MFPRQHDSKIIRALLEPSLKHIYHSEKTLTSILSDQQKMTASKLTETSKAVVLLQKNPE